MASISEWKVLAVCVLSEYVYGRFFRGVPEKEQRMAEEPDIVIEKLVLVTRIYYFCHMLLFKCF